MLEKAPPSRSLGVRGLPFPRWPMAGGSTARDLSKRCDGVAEGCREGEAGPGVGDARAWAPCRMNEGIPALPRVLASHFLGPSSFPPEPQSPHLGNRFIPCKAVHQTSCALCQGSAQCWVHTDAQEAPFPCAQHLSSLQHHRDGTGRISEVLASLPPREASTMFIPQTISPSIVTGKDTCEGQGWDR